MLALETNNIKDVNYNVDIIIFRTLFSGIINKEFSLDSLKNVNKKIALNIDKIFSQTELLDLKVFLKETIKYKVEYYIFSDWGAYEILQELGVKSKLIYNAKTICCSLNDIEQYNALGVSCMVSTELTLEDINAISNLENNAILCYGFNNIFYSKRKLISLFSKYSNINITNKELMIVEETRKENYPICENINGTFIFTPYIYCLFKELNELNTHNIFIINDLFINNIEEVINVYNKGFNNGFDNELWKNLYGINDNLGNGFLYLKPSILKEKDNE